MTRALTYLANIAYAVGSQTSTLDPHHVAIMSCFTEDRTDCAFLCSGTLISPKIVLTVRSCVEDPMVPFGKRRPLLDARHTYVHVGATKGPLSDSQNRELIGVSSMKGTDVHLNHNYPHDFDIGLIELNQCIKTKHLPRVATMGVEELSQCQSLSYTRLGKDPSLPNVYHPSPGRLLENRAHILPLTDCIASIEVLRRTNHNTGHRMFLSKNDVVPDLHFCFKSDPPACTSDRGSGLVDTSTGFLEGVISFMNPKDMHLCSVGPSYAHRTAPMAKWISDEMGKLSKCEGWPVPKSFASWPVDPMPPYTDVYKAIRCKDQEWQCADDSCVARSKVCDDSPTCKDGSDEVKHLCKGFEVSLPFGRALRPAAANDSAKRRMPEECENVIAPVISFIEDEYERMERDLAHTVASAPQTLMKNQWKCEQFMKCADHLDDHEQAFINAYAFCEELKLIREYEDMRERFISTSIGNQIQETCLTPKDNPLTILTSAGILSAVLLAALLLV